jgi:hypothetical protein
VEPISPKELLGQLRDVLELLASSADQQEAWLNQSNLPVSELVVHLDLAWPLWETRLRETGMVDDETAKPLDTLKKYVMTFANDEHAHLFEVSALYGAPEWDRTRVLARSALGGLGPTS